ncbi:MAG: hypothetical protein ACYDBT_17210 [Desulfobulbaceae bacterium]
MKPYQFPSFSFSATGRRGSAQAGLPLSANVTGLPLVDYLSVR